jgi:hypothetical protein
MVTDLRALLRACFEIQEVMILGEAFIAGTQIVSR